MATDEQQLEAEIQELAPRLLRFCYARSRSWAIAEDVSQEVLTALVRRWRRYGAPDSPGAFCFGIARRRVARQLGRQDRELPWDEHAARSERDRQPEQPDARLLRTERVHRQLTELQKLSPEDREALLLVVAGGLELKAVAQMLNIGLGALKMRIHRARKKLKNGLQREPVSAHPNRADSSKGALQANSEGPRRAGATASQLHRSTKRKVT